MNAHWHQELTHRWQQVQAMTGSKSVAPELTTVTKRVRRIFTWSMMQYTRFLVSCHPTDIFINFANYLDANMAPGKSAMGTLRDTHPAVHQFIEGIDMHAYSVMPPRFRPVVRLLGIGAEHSQMVEIER